MKTRQVFIGTSLPPDEHEAFRELAETHGRSVRGQMRLLCRQALATAGVAISQPQPHPAVAKAKRSRRAVALLLGTLLLSSHGELMAQQRGVQPVRIAQPAPKPTFAPVNKPAPKPVWKQPIPPTRLEVIQTQLGQKPVPQRLDAMPPLGQGLNEPNLGLVLLNGAGQGALVAALCSSQIVGDDGAAQATEEGEGSSDDGGVHIDWRYPIGGFAVAFILSLGLGLFRRSHV